MCLCLVTQSCLILCYPMDFSLPGSSVHGDSPGSNTGVDCHALLPGIKPTSPTLQVDSLPSEPPGKPTSEVEIGNLTNKEFKVMIIKMISLIQGLNLGLPHCRQILYHLSHQGSQSYICVNIKIAIITLK